MSGARPRRLAERVEVVHVLVVRVRQAERLDHQRREDRDQDQEDDEDEPCDRHLVLAEPAPEELEGRAGRDRCRSGCIRDRSRIFPAGIAGEIENARQAGRMLSRSAATCDPSGGRYAAASAASGSSSPALCGLSGERCAAAISLLETLRGWWQAAKCPPA